VALLVGQAQCALCIELEVAGAEVIAQMALCILVVLEPEDLDLMAGSPLEGLLGLVHLVLGNLLLRDLVAAAVVVAAFPTAPQAQAATATSAVAEEAAELHLEAQTVFVQALVELAALATSLLSQSKENQ